MNSRILISLISIFFCPATNSNFSPSVVWRCIHALLAYALSLREKSVSGISPGSFSAEKTFLSSQVSLWAFYRGFFTFQRWVNSNLLNSIRGDGSSSIFSLAIKEVPVDRSPLCRRKGESFEGLIAWLLVDLTTRVWDLFLSRYFTVFLPCCDDNQLKKAFIHYDQCSKAVYIEISANCSSKKHLKIEIEHRVFCSLMNDFLKLRSFYIGLLNKELGYVTVCMYLLYLF